MFRVVAFKEARAGVPAFGEVAGLPDPHVRVEGDNIYVPAETPHLIAVMLGATTATSGDISRARLWLPSRRSVFLPNFVPTGTAAFEPGSPIAFNNFMQHNMKLVPGEVMQCHTINTGTNTETTSCLVWLGDGIYVVPPGKEIIQKRATVSFTATAYAWINGALTFDEALEAGVYAVVGMRVISANGIAARLIFTGQGPRPGAPVQDAYSDIELPLFRHGNLGIWGIFTHDSPPTMDWYGVGTDTSAEVYLDLVKLG